MRHLKCIQQTVSPYLFSDTGVSNCNSTLYPQVGESGQFETVAESGESCYYAIHVSLLFLHFKYMVSHLHTWNVM